MSLETLTIQASSPSAEPLELQLAKLHRELASLEVSRREESEDFHQFPFSQATLRHLLHQIWRDLDLLFRTSLKSGGQAQLLESRRRSDEAKQRNLQGAQQHLQARDFTCSLESSWSQSRVSPTNVLGGVTIRLELGAGSFDQ